MESQEKHGAESGKHGAESGKHGAEPGKHGAEPGKCGYGFSIKKALLSITNLLVYYSICLMTSVSTCAKYLRIKRLDESSLYSLIKHLETDRGS